MSLDKENSFLRVRNLLADELIINLKLQKDYDFLNISFEGSQLEKDFIKLDSRWKNIKHLNKIQNK